MKKKLKTLAGIRLSEKASERVMGYAVLTGKSHNYVVGWIVERFDEVVTMNVGRERVKAELEALAKLESARKASVKNRAMYQRELALARQRK